MIIMYNKQQFILLFIYCISSLCHYPILACWGDPQHDYGEITKDPTILSGTRLELNCSLNKKEVVIENNVYAANSSMIFFKFEGKRVPAYKIELINELVARLVINRSTIENAGKYYCYLQLPDRNPLVCLSNVIIGYAPKLMPEDKFKCVSMHMKNLTCTWDPPETYVETQYEIKELVNMDGVIYPGLPPRNCGDRINETTCQWRLSTDPIYRVQARKLSFGLKSKNRFGQFYQTFTMDHYNIIIPDIPQRFSIQNISSTSVKLAWADPKILSYEMAINKHLKYQIKCFRDQLNASVKWKEDDLVVLNVGHVNEIEIKDLIPFNKYRVQLRCRMSDKTTPEVWSRFVKLTFETKPGPPVLAPQLIPGAYEVQDEHHSRSITLFWSAVPMKHRNAKGFYYIISYLATGGEGREERGASSYENSVNITDIKKTNYRFTGLDMNRVYSFKMYSANEFGFSHDYSSIVVDKSHKLSGKPTDVIVSYHGQGRYEVKWKYSREDALFKVFWCPDIRPRPFICQGSLGWSELVKKKRNTTLHLANETNYQFAVSAMQPSEPSSSLSWSSCIIPVGKLGRHGKQMYNCSSELGAVDVMNRADIIRIAVGSVLALLLLALLLFLVWFLFKWIKRKIDAVTEIKIQLPEGLQSRPFPDMNVKVRPEGRVVMREMDHHRADSQEYEIDLKNRHGSGASSGSSNDGLLTSRSFSSDTKYHKVWSAGSSPKKKYQPNIDLSAIGIELDRMLVHSDNANMLGNGGKIDINNCQPEVEVIGGQVERRASESSGSKDSGLDVSSTNSRKILKSVANLGQVSNEGGARSPPSSLCSNIHDSSTGPKNPQKKSSYIPLATFLNPSPCPVNF